MTALVLLPLTVRDAQDRPPTGFSSLGIDALLTMQCFLKLRQLYFDGRIDSAKFAGQITNLSA